jgi:hypothetical protein
MPRRTKRQTGPGFALGDVYLCLFHWCVVGGQVQGRRRLGASSCHVYKSTEHLGHGEWPTVTVTVTGNLLNTKVLTLVSRQLSQPVQSPNDMKCRPPGTRQGPLGPALPSRTNPY